MTTISDLTLNFPTFAYKLQKSDGRLMIFDEVGKKYRVLTPEEWVRQHCLNYLLHHLNYPANLIKLEQSLTVNQLKRRSDITVYDRKGELFLLVECKAPHVALDAQVVHQVGHYQSLINAKFFAITNGITHHIFSINPSSQSIQELKNFPIFA